MVYRRLALLLVALTFLAICPHPAVADEVPKEDFGLSTTFQMNGITPSFDVSALKGMKYSIPDAALFYIDKGHVNLDFVVQIPAKLAGRLNWESGDWLEHFDFRGCYRVTNEEKLEVDAAEFGLSWSDPKVVPLDDGAITCIATLTLRQSDGKAVPPGFYQLQTLGLRHTIDVPILSAEMNPFFATSLLKSEEDKLNWLEARADALARPGVGPKQLTPVERGRLFQQWLAQAEQLYADFLKLRPDDDVVLLKLADTHERRRQYEAALAVYQDVLALWTRNQGLLRVVTWNRLDVRQDSFDIFRRALEAKIEALRGIIEQDAASSK